MKNIRQEKTKVPIDIQELESKWERIVNSYRKEYPTLLEADINYRVGEFDDMTQRIARRTNRTRESVQTEIQNWPTENPEEEL